MRSLFIITHLSSLQFGAVVFSEGMKRNGGMTLCSYCKVWKERKRSMLKIYCFWGFIFLVLSGFDRVDASFCLLCNKHIYQTEWLKNKQTKNCFSDWQLSTLLWMVGLWLHEWGNGPPVCSTTQVKPDNSTGRASLTTRSGGIPFLATTPVLITWITDTICD